MKLAVLASDSQKKEIESSVFFSKHQLLFTTNHSNWPTAEVYIDLSNDRSPTELASLVKLLPAIVIVNSVTDTIGQIHPEFIRINGWPGFLKGGHPEAAALETTQKKAKGLVDGGMIFVGDEPGFVSARIVAMIINEAFFTWEAGTGSKEDIDIAMKLGTGYPYGPFEWGEMIGLRRVKKLLERLATKNSDYEIASWLTVNV